MTTETLTLSAFLLERIAEDEAVALAAGRDGAASWEQSDPVRAPGHVVSAKYTVTYDEGSPSEEDAVHIARNDPARVLATCKAHRQLVEDCPPMMTFGGWQDSHVLRALASIYADHPDFQESWRA